jgi:hypothetical protein
MSKSRQDPPAADAVWHDRQRVIINGRRVTRTVYEEDGLAYVQGHDGDARRYGRTYLHQRSPGVWEAYPRDEHGVQLIPGHTALVRE